MNDTIKLTEREQTVTLKRCPSTHLGVPCRRIAGHDGKHGGHERGRWEHWQWTDDPDDELVTSVWNTFGRYSSKPF